MTEKIRALIDWFAFTVHGITDPLAVIREILGMDTALFTLGRGLNGYQQMYEYKNIKVCFSPYLVEQFGDMGIYVCMSGSGCRTFENYSSFLNSHKYSNPFFDLISWCCDNKECVNVTRVDLALDDRNNFLDMRVISDAVDSRSDDVRVRSRAKLGGINKAVALNGKQVNGSTVYIGTKKSDFFIRIYDKAAEQESKQKFQRGSLGSWVRLEMVFARLSANKLIEVLNERPEQLGEVVAAILNDKLAFVNDDDSNVSRCTPCKWWSDFVNSVERIHVVAREAMPPLVDATREWLKYQVLPSVQVMLKTYGFSEFLRWLDEAEERLTPKHEALIRTFKGQLDGCS